MISSNGELSFRASGNIAPSRFVTMSGSSTVAQSNAASASLIGISGRDLRKFDSTYHAIDGDTCRVHGEGSTALLEFGGTVSAGALITADSNGKGVAWTTASTPTKFVGAIALKDAVSGDLAEVLVRFNANVS